MGTHLLSPQIIATQSIGQLTVELKGLTKITGYIKTNFAINQNQQNPIFDTCIGAIADDKIKLVIQIADLPLTFDTPFAIGEKVEVLGRFVMDVTPPIFKCNSIGDIKHVEGKKMKRKELQAAREYLEFSSTS